MNKVIVFFIATLIFNNSCDVSKKSSEGNSNYELIPTSGIDNIKIGVSNSKDITHLLGNKKVKLKWRSNTYPLILGEFIKEIEYPELGLKFIVSGCKGRFSKKSLEYIIIDSTSKIKSSNRIGIGSNYFDLVKEFGRTKFSHGPSTTEMSYDMSFFSIEGKQQSFSIRFIQNRVSDSLSFKVEQITMSRW